MSPGVPRSDDLSPQLSLGPVAFPGDTGCPCSSYLAPLAGNHTYPKLLFETILANPPLFGGSPLAFRREPEVLLARG